MTQLLEASVVRAWMAQSVDLLGRAREEIDRLNVYPVPDGDTGTNLYLTVEAGFDAADTEPATAGLVETIDATARGTLLGARGNSGVITSQIFRGFADAFNAAAAPDAEALVDAYRRAAESAYQAVAVPREGTILSVIKAAAHGASQAGDSLVHVAGAALEAAREALALTPEQLPVLREAGVVDAGGSGLVVILEGLARALSGDASPIVLRGQVAQPVAHTPTVGYTGPEYEVMYLLDAPDDAVPTFRGQLNDLGDSVVVVGGGGLWNIHVHTDDIGAAIERGVEIGVPKRIRVTRLLEAESLREQGRGPTGERGLVAVAKGDGIAEYLEEQGVVVVRAPDRGRASTAELLAGIEACVQADVIVLPGDKDTVPVAEAAAAAARDKGIRTSVVPTRSIVQSLAAIAVHDDANRFDDDVIAMGRAAGATRYAGVTIAAKTSSTGAGTCHPGDVLGLVHGDIVEIGDDVVAVAERVVARIVSRGTELLTVVVGASATDEQLEALVASVAESRPDIEVDVLPGGQAHWLLILGAE